MFDGKFRAPVDAAVKPLGAMLRKTRLTPDHLTVVGLLVGAVTLGSALPHLLSALSFNRVVSLCGIAVAMVGVVSLWRRDWRTASLLTLFPLAYLLYFSTQRAMLVRNLQLMQPFLALFAACGIVACARAARGEGARRLLYFAAGLGRNELHVR